MTVADADYILYMGWGKKYHVSLMRNTIVSYTQETIMQRYFLQCIMHAGTMRQLVMTSTLLLFAAAAVTALVLEQWHSAGGGAGAVSEAYTNHTHHQSIMMTDDR